MHHASEDRGTPHPTEGAGYAAPFTEAEFWLDVTEPAYALQCKSTALAFFGGHPVMARIDGAAWKVSQIDLDDRPAQNVAPGTILERLADGVVIQTRDGVARLIGQVDMAS